MAVRRELHRRGLRYRVDMSLGKASRARPDILFRSRRIAVFVDGCFWHRCPDHGSSPDSNRDWWEAKLTANVQRDRRHDAELVEAGWRVIRVWEHEDPVLAADLIERLVRVDDMDAGIRAGNER